MKPARSLARYSAAFATSSSVPRRPRQQNFHLEPSRVIRGRQGIVFGIDDEYGEQLRRFSIARVATDQMMCSRRLIPALARAVDVFGLTLYPACSFVVSPIYLRTFPKTSLLGP